jgi:pyruvate dehydrogenase (quinone)
MTSQELEHRIFPARPAIRPSLSDLKKLAKLLDDSDRVTLFGGAGCAGARREVLELAERLKAPIVYSFSGKEFLEHDDPYATGMTGLLGTESGHYSLEKADLIFLLGTDFPYTAWYPKKPKIVQLDIRAEHLGRRSQLELGLMGDVKATLEELLPLLKQKNNDKHLKACLDRSRETQKSLARHSDTNNRTGPLAPETVTSILSEVADDDAVFTVDTGMTAVWAARYLRMKRDRRLIGSFNHGSMANAMPQAIGAQLAFPKRQVISMSGDGGFAMLMGDLLTIAQYQLPVKLVVYNNSTLGMVKLEMRVAGYEDFGVDVPETNFAKIAEAAGVRGFRVENAQDLKSAFSAVFRHKGPALVDVVTNPNALALPPTIDAQEVAGYGLYVAKQTLHGRLFESIEELKGNLP